MGLPSLSLSLPLRVTHRQKPRVRMNGKPPFKVPTKRGTVVPARTQLENDVHPEKQWARATCNTQKAILTFLKFFRLTNKI